jgi:hypothetical protein
VDTYGTYDDGRSAARGIAFELFVAEILKSERGTELISASMLGGADHDAADYGVDFVASSGGRILLVEAKAATPQTRGRIIDLSRRLRAAGERYSQGHPGQPEPALVLACPGVFPQSKVALAEQDGLVLWDGPYLRNKAAGLGIEVPSQVVYADQDGYAPGHDLVSRLHGIHPGIDDWPAYEKFCEDLLSFLFVPPLKPPNPQTLDERHVNRRDYVLANYAVDGGFWHFMRTHYEAHLVVAEVKNLSAGPGKSSILQVANYLNLRGTGLFALILARRDLTPTARWICREQWVQHSKLIVGLSDDDVIQMVRTKIAGGDPTELIRQKIEDFRLKI